MAYFDGLDVAGELVKFVFEAVVFETFFFEVQFILLLLLDFDSRNDDLLVLGVGH